MRCKNCHYSLANLAKRRCPECGREFDPNDPRTWARSTHTRWRKLAISAVIGLVLAVLCTCFLMDELDEDGPHTQPGRILFVIYLSLFVWPLAFAGTFGVYTLGAFVRDRMGSDRLSE